MTMSVNGVEIPDEAIHREMRYHPAGSPDAAQRGAARALVIRELLLPEARRSAVTPDPEATDPEEGLIRALMTQVVHAPDADAAARRRCYYEAHQHRFRTPVVHHVSHIVLPAAPADHDGRTALARAGPMLVASATIPARPVETPYGVHLVYLRNREGGDPLPFEAVQAQISEYMEQHVRRRAIGQYLQRLVGDARIQGIDLESADTPLVQ
jgi:peptidyl-prolyl cis-trans isomerase C